MRTRQLACLFVCWLAFCSVVRAEFSFFLIDNFESGNSEGWYHFGNLEMAVEKIPSSEAGTTDTIAESGGDYSLKVKGSATNWYAGGFGKIIATDAGQFNRLQLDVGGGEKPGQMKIEIFLQGQPGRENRFTAEVPILGKGVSRYSLPLSAFRPDSSAEAAAAAARKIVKVQFILLTDSPTGEAEANIDNILLTY